MTDEQQDSGKREGLGVDPPIDRGVDSVQSPSDFLQESGKPISPTERLMQSRYGWVLYDRIMSSCWPEPERPQFFPDVYFDGEASNPPAAECRCIHCVEYE